MRTMLSLTVTTLVLATIFVSTVEAARKRPASNATAAAKAGSNGTPAWVEAFWREQASHGR